jgi:hypothetical protein
MRDDLKQASLDLEAALQEYRAGLEAEIVLLHQLERMPAHADTQSVDLSRLAEIADERERVVATLVALEHNLRPLRTVLAERRQDLRGLAAFETVAARHREAGELVARILAADSESLAALREAESARREAAMAVERGETTLAAYRRVVAPPSDNARIVNRRG